MQKDLLSKLPPPLQEKEEQKKPSELFRQYCDTILEVLSSEKSISEPLAKTLTEVQLIDASERDQVKTITCEPIKIRALMRAVDIMIEKAVLPDIQLQRFMGVLSLYDCFIDVVDELQEAGLFYQNLK